MVKKILILAVLLSTAIYAEERSYSFSFLTTDTSINFETSQKNHYSIDARKKTNLLLKFSIPRNIDGSKLFVKVEYNDIKISIPAKTQTIKEDSLEKTILSFSLTSIIWEYERQTVQTSLVPRLYAEEEIEALLASAYNWKLVKK